MKVRLAGVVGESVVDGPGIRYTVFVQGCPHHCPGCHNPQTHDFDGGYEGDTEELFEQFRVDPILKGITLSGGEPFCQPGPLAELARQVHALGKDVVVYTGYTYEKLSAMEDPEVRALLAETDLLVDGPFIEEEKDLELPFRGSANQRLICMEATRREGRPVLRED